MIHVDTSQLELPWMALDNSASDLVGELKKEVTLGHVLFEAREIQAIAKREDCDDVLFGVDNLLAVVHLTWSGKEDNPQWPHTPQPFGDDGIGPHDSHAGCSPETLLPYHHRFTARNSRNRRHSPLKIR